MKRARRVPLLRCSGLLEQRVGGDVVVVDPVTQRAHALTGQLADVWLASDAGAWTGADTDEFWAAVDELTEAGLLRPAAGISRRAMLARTGAVAAGVGLVSIGLPTVDAAASGVTGPSLVGLSPTSGPRGTVVTVTATNFFPNGTITSVTVGGISVTPSSTIINGSGTAIFTITVPSNAPLGADAVVVTDNHSNSGSNTFTVTTPTLTSSPTSLPRNGNNQSVTLTGTGFAPNSTITLTRGADFSAATIPGSITTNASGSFTATVTGINYPNGSGSGSFTATDTFNNTATVTIPH